MLTNQHRCLLINSFSAMLLCVGLFLTTPFLVKAENQKEITLSPNEEIGVQKLRLKFAEILTAHGFTPKVVHKVGTLYQPYLLHSLQADSKNNVNWSQVEASLQYWKQLFALDRNGKEALNEFIYKTKDANPFSFLEIDLEQWKSAKNTMIRIGLFSSENGYDIKSFRSFLLKRESFDGVKILSTKSLDEWKKWEQIFRQAKPSSETVGETVWSYILNTKDSTQNGLINLSKILNTSLAETLSLHLNLLNTDILLILFKAKPTTVIASTENISDIFTMIKRYQQPGSKKQSVQMLTHELETLFRNFEVRQALQRKGPKSLRRSCRSVL